MHTDSFVLLCICAVCSLLMVVMLFKAWQCLKQGCTVYAVFLFYVNASVIDRWLLLVTCMHPWQFCSVFSLQILKSSCKWCTICHLHCAVGKRVIEREIVIQTLLTGEWLFMWTLVMGEWSFMWTLLMVDRVFLWTLLVGEWLFQWTLLTVDWFFMWTLVMGERLFMWTLLVGLWLFMWTLLIGEWFFMWTLLVWVVIHVNLVSKWAHGYSCEPC